MKLILLLSSLIALASIARPTGAATVESRPFGQTADGTAVRLFEFRNQNRVVAKVMSYGAILTELWVPDADGLGTNVVLGFDNLARYLQGHPSFGATIGRFANRIAGAEFTLDGKQYKLAANNGPNHIHGGRKGFDKVVWDAEILPNTPGRASVKFSYRSSDGEEGYPGTLEIAVTYTLTDENALRIDYEAVTDKPTPINVTNHSYFNLAGHGDVLDHVLMIAAKRYTPVTNALIPTGEIAPVEGTPLDFTSPRRIGDRIDQLKPRPGGYDHNYVLDHGGRELGLAARVTEPKSGRVMEVRTTEPGVQLYTGNFLGGGITGVGGVEYGRHAGLCLETQHFPDSVHHDQFPSVILRPGETFRSTTEFRFRSGQD